MSVLADLKDLFPGGPMRLGEFHSTSNGECGIDLKMVGATPSV
jgi:hypothetical protein